MISEAELRQRKPEQDSNGEKLTDGMQRLKQLSDNLLGDALEEVFSTGETKRE